MNASDLTHVFVASFRAAVARGDISPQTVAGIMLLVHEGDAEMALAALPTFFPEDVRMREFLGVVRNLFRSVIEAKVDERAAHQLFTRHERESGWSRAVYPAPRESTVAPRLHAIEGGKP